MWLLTLASTFSLSRAAPEQLRRDQPILGLVNCSISSLRLSI